MDKIIFKGRSKDWLVGQNETGWFFHPADSDGKTKDGFYCTEREVMYILDIIDRSLANVEGGA